MNENKNPLVSIIIPVYNDAEFLHESLDSAVNQTLKNIEIICVNDSSTDNSHEIINEYAEKDSRVKVINRLSNGGTLIARKDGAAAAQGIFTMFLDSNDYLALNACETAYNLIVKNDVDILEFSYSVNEYDEEGNVSNVQVLGTDGEQFFDSQEEIQNFYFLNDSASGNLRAEIFKTELIKLAFSKIDNFYCSFDADSCAMFYVIYYASKMKRAVTEPLYFEKAETGIKEISVDKFEQYCRQKSLAAELIRKFLEREGTLEAQEKYLLAWQDKAIKACCLYYVKNVKKENFDAVVDILLSSWNEKENAEKITLHFLTELRKYINLTTELDNRRKELLAQMENDEKSARIKELQAFCEEQDREKERFLQEIARKDEKISELESAAVLSSKVYNAARKIKNLLRKIPAKIFRH